MGLKAKRLAALAAAVFTLWSAGAPAPAVAQAAAEQSFRGAQFVYAALGEQVQEQGLRLISDLPDGQTVPVAETGGRQSVAGGGAERFFYFDVHDTYFRGGQNKVRVTITYRDLGLTPIFLEYDAYDLYRPGSLAPEVAYRRVPVATRTNSEGWKTVSVDIADARFAGSQSGGADFRIGSGDDLVLSSVSVLLMGHEEAQAPVRIVIDGRAVAFDPNEVQPFVHPTTNRTLVPFRTMFRALGVADTDIVWHNETRTVEARKGQTTIMLPIDSDTAMVNGRPVKLDQPATIVAGRTVVPLRFVADQFGLKVEWNGQTRVATLTTPVAPANQLPPGAPPPPADPGQTQP